MDAVEFYELGLEEIFPVSAISGTGTGELLDRVVELLPDLHDDHSEDKNPKIAFVGRPNVGKSSLMNALLKSERCIVTDIPGTTRDSINSQLTYNNKEYTLIDTAGLRKRAKVKENIEFFSNVRTDRSIRDADVVILILDAMQGFDAQDKRIIRDAEKYNKGIVIALNKWDIVPEKDTNLLKEFETYIYERIRTSTYIPVVSISALKGTRIERVIDVAELVIQERKKKISTPEMNDFVQKILKERQLPMKRGVSLKFNTPFR